MSQRDVRPSLVPQVLIAIAVMGFVARAGATQDGIAVSTGDVLSSRRSDELSEAKASFEAAARAASEGDYGAALALMRRSYELSNHPWLLFNLGSLHEKLGDCRAALQSFEAYVAAVPNGKRLEEARSSIAALRPSCAEPSVPAPTLLAEAATTPRSADPAPRFAPVAPPAPVATSAKKNAAVLQGAPSSAPSGARVLGISALAGGAAVAGVAAYFAWSAQDRDDSFQAVAARAHDLPAEERPAYETVQSLEAARDADRTRALVFSGVSAVLLGGGLWLLLRSDSDESPSRGSQTHRGFELCVGHGDTLAGSWSTVF
jgi:hypothetical protein